MANRAKKQAVGKHAARLQCPAAVAANAMAESPTSSRPRCPLYDTDSRAREQPAYSARSGRWVIRYGVTICPPIRCS